MTQNLSITYVACLNCEYHCAVDCICELIWMKNLSCNERWASDSAEHTKKFTVSIRWDFQVHFVNLQIDAAAKCCFDIEWMQHATSAQIQCDTNCTDSVWNNCKNSSLSLDADTDLEKHIAIAI